MPAATQSIREIVAMQSSAAAILQRFDIDLCARADESLSKACAELQLSMEQVLEKLADAAAGEGKATAADLAGYSLSRIIQHIVRMHHQYVRRELPRLVAMSHQLAGRHEGRASALKSVAVALDALHTEMLAHLQKEEQILFPFIAQMGDQAAGFTPPGSARFHTVGQPIAMMIREHDSAEALIAEIRHLTNNFEMPARACSTHIALYTGLREFEADLREHARVENEVLFPRAIEMESTLSQLG